MDQSFTGVVHAHPDVVELPSEALDPETLEQFRQMGEFHSHRTITAAIYLEIHLPPIFTCFLDFMIKSYHINF